MARPKRPFACAGRASLACLHWPSDGADVTTDALARPRSHRYRTPRRNVHVISPQTCHGCRRSHMYQKHGRPADGMGRAAGRCIGRMEKGPTPGSASGEGDPVAMKAAGLSGRTGHHATRRIFASTGSGHHGQDMYGLFPHTVGSAPAGVRKSRSGDSGSVGCGITITITTPSVEKVCTESKQSRAERSGPDYGGPATRVRSWTVCM